MKAYIYLSLFIVSSALCQTTANEANFFTNRGTVAHGDDVQAVSWLGRDGNMYVGLGGETDVNDFELRVVKYNFFDEGTLTILPGDANQNHGVEVPAAVFSVDWITRNGVTYLAMGGNQSSEDGGDVNNTTRVFLFDHPDEILTLKSSGNHGATVRSVAWFEVNEILYLATGGLVSGGVTTRLYRIDPSNPSLVLQQKDTENHGATVNSVAWLSCGEDMLLATGGVVAGGVTTRLYRFNANTELLTVLPTAQQNHGATVNELAWLVHNGAIYLATAGGNVVRIYRYDQTAVTFTEVATLTLTDPDFDININTIAWVNIGGFKYLAIGVELVDDGGTGRVFIYRFNVGATPAFTHITSATRDHDGFINDVAWLQYGAQTFLVFGGNTANEGPAITNRVYQVNFVEDSINALMRRKYFQAFAKDTSPRATAHC